MFAKSLAAVLLAGALITAAAPAPAQEGDKQEKPEGDKPEGDKSEDKGDKDSEKPAKKEGSKKSNLVGRVSSELSTYTDTESVTVVTPTIGGSIENPLSEWSIGANYLVDIVSAASVDIVATASQRWREVRHGASFDAAAKPGGLVGLGASGSFSVEPDYVGFAVGGTVSIDLFQKNATLLAGYSFGRGEAGRGGTPFSVFSHVLYSHSINGALTLLVNRDTLLAFIGDAIIESGNQSKPYRYVPMFAPDVAVQVPVGASIDTVNQDRLNLRPLEQLPLSRDRFAMTVRLAHRFSTSTLRVSERFYRDTWGLTASTTDVRFVKDIGSRVALWPHARLHLQTPVAFWQRAYSASQDSTGAWQVPTLRTGDRELGPSRGLTGGAGIQIKVGPDASPSDFTLNLVGESVWTSYLNDIYISSRVSGLGVLSMEAVFE